MHFYQSTSGRLDSYLAKRKRVLASNSQWGPISLVGKPFIEAALLELAEMDRRELTWTYEGTNEHAQTEFLDLAQLNAHVASLGIQVVFSETYGPFPSRKIQGTHYWFKRRLDQWVEKGPPHVNNDTTRVFFQTVGELRKAIEGVPDDRLLICQVVGKESGAWNMESSFTAKVPHGTMAVLTLDHPQLQRLDMNTPNDPNTGWDRS